jgi:hypothetical protein
LKPVGIGEAAGVGCELAGVDGSAELAAGADDLGEADGLLAADGAGGLGEDEQPAINTMSRVVASARAVVTAL